MDVASSGFNGVLSNGDNTVQKALQKVDDYVPPDITVGISWSPTVGTTSTGLTINHFRGQARRIGEFVILTGSFRADATTAYRTGSFSVNVPTGHLNQSPNAHRAGIVSPALTEALAELSVDQGALVRFSGNNTLTFVIAKNGSASLLTYFSYFIVYNTS